MSSFSKEASRAESDPFRANVSIGGGFSAYLQKPDIYPDIHLKIGCDKVRGDVRVMIVPTTDAAGGDGFCKHVLHRFISRFSIFSNEWGRVEGLAPAQPLNKK